MIIVEEIQPAGLGAIIQDWEIDTLTLPPGKSAVAVMEDARLTKVASLLWPCPQEAFSGKETNSCSPQSAARFRSRKLQSRS